MNRLYLALSVALASLFSTGCPPPPVTPPEILSFLPNMSHVPSPGGTDYLTWDVADATQITIDNGVGDVSNETEARVSVSQTTTYTLTATNQLGTRTATATVTIGPVTTPPVIYNFTAVAGPADQYGDRNIQLSWSVEDASTVLLDQQIGDVTGRQWYTTSASGPARYVLTATNSVGSVFAAATPIWPSLQAPSGSN